jgi:hypothetical protein
MWQSIALDACVESGITRTCRPWNAQHRGTPAWRVKSTCIRAIEYLTVLLWLTRDMAPVALSAVCLLLTSLCEQIAFKCVQRDTVSDSGNSRESGACECKMYRLHSTISAGAALAAKHCYVSQFYGLVSWPHHSNQCNGACTDAVLGALVITTYCGWSFFDALRQGGD